jgi:hypothetical protein
VPASVGLTELSRTARPTAHGGEECVAALITLSQNHWQFSFSSRKRDALDGDLLAERVGIEESKRADRLDVAGPSWSGGLRKWCANSATDHQHQTALSVTLTVTSMRVKASAGPS